jgi:hypothetical protein
LRAAVGSRISAICVLLNSDPCVMHEFFRIPAVKCKQVIIRIFFADISQSDVTATAMEMDVNSTEIPLQERRLGRQVRETNVTVALHLTTRVCVGWRNDDPAPGQEHRRRMDTEGVEPLHGEDK